ncbi:ABC transporter ATP-binding protein [Tardiphaga sp. 862_B3_N4_1]|uniref:ABC transporter ATP-binding protein n=1 Tax=Tardiphaga sp. 862_B3_N4_1 TaxID=3240764 RepID=UPI003F20865C
MSAIVEARGLGKRYRIYSNPWDRFVGVFVPSRAGAARELWALRDIDVSVATGKCLGVIGANGAGKSTLLKLLTGVVQPTVGSLQMHGKVLALLELGTGFNGELTGQQNLVAVGAMLGYSQETVLCRLDAIRAFADIGDYFDRPVKIYSSGMVVRLAFSFYVSLKPEILIVDEALSVGDFFFQQKCAAAMRELKEQGTTLLFVSHDMAAIQEMCDEVIWLDHGRALLTGDANTVVGSYYVRTLGQSVDEADATPAAAPEVGAVSAAHMTERVAEIQRDDVLADVPSVGSQGASLLGLRVRSANGTPTLSFPSGETMTMECAIQFHRDVPCGNFGVLMTDDEDRTVWSAANSNQGIWLEPKRQGDVAIFTLEVVLALPPGRYHFNIGTAEVDRYDPLFAVWNDTRIKAFSIDVVESDATLDRSGVAYLDMSVSVL